MSQLISIKHIKIGVLSILLSPSFLWAQSYSEGIKKGNEHYKNGEFNLAAESYQSSSEENNNGFEAQFNLGDALYKQDKFEEAAIAYQKSAELAQNKKDKAAALHNLGNAMLKTEKYKEAAGAYKEALRNNPTDQDTRYNLAKAQRALQVEKQNNEDQKEGDKPKPSEYAKRMKAKADKLVEIGDFIGAFTIMQEALKKDKTVMAYQNYISKLQNVTQIDQS